MSKPILKFLRPSPLSFLIIAGLILFGCSNKYIDEVDRGAGYNYQPGFPELRLATTGQINESNIPTIIVSGNIVYGSLVYSRNEDILEATLLIEIIIRNTSDGNDTVTRREFERKVLEEDDAIINSQNVLRFEEIFEVPPGNYEIRTVVTDQVSGKSTTQTSETEIPNPEENISHITEIRILGKNTDQNQSQFNQATTYDVPSSLDSLKFVFQVTNNNPDKPIELESRLLKFRSDTSIARPMHFNDYSPSSIPYLGIDYNKFEVIQSSTRSLNQPGSVVIEFIFTDLERGNYRLEVTSDIGEDDELYRARDFSIKSPNYPSLKTAEELARPLAYLMDEKEYDKLMAIKDPKKKKAAIDRFWLTNVQNSNIAKNVISLYYQRVEEANKQFSNFKEGWKTDPGMIYILFGPPWYSDRFSDQMYWSYSYNQEDPEKNFSLIEPKMKSKFYPFNHYLLRRNSFYYNIQYQQKQRWRTGSILTYNL